MLYEGLALLGGALIAIMVTANGLLTAQTGPWISVVLIHVAGLVTSLIALAIRRKPVALRAPGLKWTMYLAGVGGVYSTITNNICFAPLGAALMLAMCVVGQILCSSLIDHFGWFGMTRYPFQPIKLVGFLLMAAGILAMTVFEQALPVTGTTLFFALVALSTGLMLGITNVVNTALSKRIGIFPGTLVNYITGLVTIVLLTTLLGKWQPVAIPSLHPFMLTGGLLGVLIIAITSFAMPHIPVVYVTVILFTGQVLMGIAIDRMNGMPITWAKIIGCALIAAGLLWNMRIDRQTKSRTK